MKKNIFKFINTATKDKRISHSEFRLLLCLISYNTFEKIFPSLKVISNDTSIKCIGDISIKLNHLQELGYIGIQRRWNKSNIYTLNIDINPSTEIKKQTPMKIKAKPKKAGGKNSGITSVIL